MELTKIKSKKGKELYVTDLESIVEDNYDQAYINLIHSNKSAKTEFVCVCPLCRDRKGPQYSNRKLYITSDFSVGHCFVCDTAFVNLDNESPTDKPIQEEFDIDTNFEVDGLTLPNIDLSLLLKLKPANESQDAIKYLYDRNPYIIPEKYDLRYIKNKLIIPFKIEGKDIFYQIRYLIPFNPKMKYYTPAYIKPFYIASDHWDPYRPTILTEGVFSAIGVDCTGINANIVALIGNCITKYQMSLLRYLGFNDLYCYLDKIELSKKLMSNIRDVHGINAKFIPPVTSGSELDQEEELRRIGPKRLQEHILNAIYYKPSNINNRDSFEIDFSFNAANF
jgi:hypothetical protein